VVDEAIVIELRPQHGKAEKPAAENSSSRPSAPQIRWLRRGLTQPGGKLPLFDEEGQRVSDQTVRSCIDRGWAEPWFANPIKPDWLVCRLTEDGRDLMEDLEE